MRKNSYNDHILMISRSDLCDLFCFPSDFKSEEVLERMRMYDRLICQALCDKNHFLNGDCEVGILMTDKVDEQLGNLVEKYSLEKGKIKSSDVKNAYLCSIVNESELSDLLRIVLIDMKKGLSLSQKKFRKKYGEDFLNYVLLHKNYSYEQNCDPTLEADKEILLCCDGTIKNVSLEKEKIY